MELMDILAKAELEITASRPLTVATGAWTLLGAWDAVALQRGSVVTPDAAAGTITVSETGPYSAMLIVNCAFDRTEELYIGFSINGADPVNWLQEQGRGANKPIDFQWYGIHQLNAGDVIQVAAQMETTETEVTLLSSTFTIAKEF